MTIIHISADYPDIHAPKKTQAIRRLVNAARDEFDQFVYSLNRVSISPLKGALSAIGTWQIGEVKSEEESMACWTYAAPSKGVFLNSSLKSLAMRIVSDIRRRGLKPELIQGHKLSIEGIIAYHAATELDVPFALSVQGNSDRTILNVRRDLWPLYRKIFHGAEIVFPFAPWALQYLEKILGKRSGPVVLLPCITEQDLIIPPKNTPPILLSAFHLRHWNLKNLPGLVAAAKYLETVVPEAELHILGGGDAGDVADIERVIARSGAGNVQLLGAVPHEKIQEYMNGAAGFAMLSHRESFGMVFIEALLAGCPVIYPADAAIDGYFDGHGFAAPVDAKNQAAINKAIAANLRNQTDLKSELSQWQKSKKPAFFQREHIEESYRKGLRAALKNAR